MFKFLYLFAVTFFVHFFYFPLGHTAAKADAFEMPSGYPSYSYSGLKTVKTWVAPHHHADEYRMRKLCWQSTLSDPEDPDSRRVFIAVKNNPGDERYFGKAFPTNPPIELPALQWINKVGKERPVTSLELAAGFGYVSWKPPFAFSEKGGTHYVNELSSPMIDLIKTRVISGRLPADLQTLLRYAPGSCFDILTDRPELRGTCDAIIVNNLEHFFNPDTHLHQFMPLIRDLLAPGGRAFLSCNTFSFGGGVNDPLYKLYLERKKLNDLYPGFHEKTAEFLQEPEGQAILVGSHTISEASRPADDREIGTTTLGEPQKVTHKGQLFLKVRQHVVCNPFAPSIYKGIVAQFPDLRVIDSFFIDRDFSTKSPLWRQGSNFAAAIIEKNPLLQVAE